MKYNFNFIKFYFGLVLLVLLNLFEPSIAYGQKSTFVSSLDRSLSLTTLMVIPFSDNVNGIYSLPMTKYIEDLIENQKRFDLVKPEETKKTDSSLKLSLDELESNSQKVQAIYKQFPVNGILAGRITKGPMGISISLTLFIGPEGLPAFQERLINDPGFELDDLLLKLKLLYQRLVDKIPYDGVLLSRTGNIVTVDKGKNQGMFVDDEFSVVQIVKIERHPKLNLIVKIENEIIGKLILSKIEDNLSFASIVSEREPGLLKKSDKYLVKKFVEYPKQALLKTGQIQNHLTEQSDANVSFGNEPKEWKPSQNPSYGKIGFLFGLGQYALSNTLTTTGGISGNNSLTPSIHLNFELWLSLNWMTGFRHREFIYNIDNPLAGSTPGKLYGKSTENSLEVAYNFLLEDSFYGPKIQMSLGFSSYDEFIDSSSPSAFNSMNYSGLSLGIGGGFPFSLSDEDLKIKPMYLGSQMHYFLSPNVAETPTTSGATSTGSVSNFSIYATYKYTQRLNWRGELLWTQLNSQFSGTGSRTPSATSVSHTQTSMIFGLEYLF